MKRIKVELGHKAYPVLVGEDCLEEGLSSLLPKRARKVAIVTQSNIEVIPSMEAEHKIFYIGDGEDK